MNPCGWNIINSILSIIAYINTSIIFLPTILLSLLFSLSSTIFRTFQSLCILIRSCTRPVLTRQAEITLAGLIPCLVISFPVALVIYIKNIVTLYPSFNLIAFESHQWYKIWPYMGSLIIWSCINNSMYSASNSSCSTVHLNSHLRLNASFGARFLLMKSTNSSHCLTYVYQA